MNGKNKNFLKKMGKFVVYGVLINQLSLPIIQSASMSVAPIVIRKNNTNLEEIGEVKNLEDYKYFNSLDYLNLANFLANQTQEEGDDCKNFSYSTFDNYQRIVNEDKRKDLSDKIRLAAGYDLKGGHIWIEYQDKGDWLPYEATKTTTIEDIKNMKMHSKLNTHRRLKFDEKDIQSIKGTKMFYPVPEGFFRGYGLIEVPIRFLKKIF